MIFMTEMIQKQLKRIEESNAWFRSSLEGETQKKSLGVMVDCRRKLKKKRNSLDGNPAAALYGESQVGKSYLIGSLLSENGEPFSITGESDNDIHNFIEEINPPGGGSESTSIVSRFSVNYKPINPKFPVKAALLSPADIVLVLCDSFYNDIKIDHNLALERESIDSEIGSLKERWENRQAQQDVFGEDDVWDMRDYFAGNFSTKAINVLMSKFFDAVSQFISKARPSEWQDIFSLLWNKNEKFTNLFAALISEYEKLNFSGTVYLPLESVLYKHGTLLDVKRLREIYAAPGKIESEYRPDTRVFLPDNSRETVFPKSYLCALAAELSFCQQETLRESKPFLNEVDLLDFPGARGRLTLPQSEISDENIPELLIRGKVAYLFNKFSDSEKISIFVLCAKHEQAAQRSMPEMLNSWINKYIGDTPEKREIFIQHSKIPPLFIVGTFFNINLEYNPLLDSKDNLSSLSFRWNQRFEGTLAVELLNTETYQWFNNWTSSDKDFKNIFLLRDFVYSESKSHIFKGFIEYKRETEEISPPGYPDFRKKLRQSFLEYPFVRRHFENPEESWDSAASMNKDGSKLIIEKLTIAADHIKVARMEKIRAELNEISQTVLAELNKHFHSDDKDEILRKEKAKAGGIQLKLDMAFGSDGIKLYGQMMRELSLDEGSVFTLYHKIINDIDSPNERNMDPYSTLRINVPPGPDDTEESYFERARKHYEQTADTFRAYLEEHKIDLKVLLSSSADRIKTKAGMLSEELLRYWLDHVRNGDLPVTRRILAANGSTDLQEITIVFEKLFKKLGLAEQIADRIRRYVDISGRAGMHYEIIADISAELLNKCVNTVGFEYLDEAAIAGLRQANEKNGLGLNLDRDFGPAQQTVEELFTKIHNWAEIVNKNPGELKTLPSYRNYLSWYDHLKIAFVYVCDIPTYDPAANEKLGNIIKECKTIGY
jgi:hypothetical protein